MSAIQYYNRYSQEVEEEEVYGESYLRWTYETFLGRLALNAFVKRALFSRWYGWRMSRPSSKRLIKPFIRQYNLDTNEFEKSPEAFSSFNDFFYRKLKPQARPVHEDGKAVVFPADGRHLGIGSLGVEEGIYVKGQRLKASQLLGDNRFSKRFDQGAAIISRLCPVDYHRFHSPVSGRIAEQYLANGSLYSVSPIGLRRNLSFLWENKRLVSLIDTEKFGYVAFIAVGATCVGSIKMTRGPGEPLVKGDELGYFAFGGSCVIILFQHGKIKLEQDLLRESKSYREMYSKIGDIAGTINYSSSSSLSN